MSETKICAQCGAEKPIEDFSKSYKKLCKECVAENSKKKRERVTAHIRELSSAHGVNPNIIPALRAEAAIAALPACITLVGRQAEMCKTAAEFAVRYADALLNELNKPNNQ